MVHYTIIAKKIIVEDTAYTTYGIDCVENGKSIERIDDISTRKEDVERTADLFNKNHLDPKQFKEAVEDSII